MHPEWNISEPHVYFNPNKKGGFRGALEYYKDNIEHKRAKDKDLYAKRKLIVYCYKEFMKDPKNTERYLKISQFLGKKQDKQLLEKFNYLVMTDDFGGLNEVKA